MNGFVNKIVCGDCLEVMKDWPDNCVDLVVTSPPYGELRSYGGGRIQFSELANCLFRTLVVGGVLVWVVKDQTLNGTESGESFRQALAFKDIGFNLHDTMIYAKEGINYPDTVRYYDAFEYMFVLSKGRPQTINLICDKINTHAGDKSSGRCRQYDDSLRPRTETFKQPVKKLGTRWNVWHYRTGYMHTSKDPIVFEHPAAFPEKLAADHIKSWSNEGDIVLDPMNGSGTTTKMARILGRRYIGIDISEKYCEIARMRLEAVDTGVPVAEQQAGQMALFTEQGREDGK
jgi:site-specific DNA-methyltransferase (adenine-specific)